MKESGEEMCIRDRGNPEYNFSDWTGNTNWQDEIFQTGFITNNNISITGDVYKRQKATSP